MGEKEKGAKGKHAIALAYFKRSLTQLFRLPKTFVGTITKLDIFACKKSPLNVVPHKQKEETGRRLESSQLARPFEAFPSHKLVSKSPKPQGSREERRNRNEKNSSRELNELHYFKCPKFMVFPSFD